MGDTSQPSATTFPFWWPWSTAPQPLNQPILPGWSFGNVTITAQNSSAPQTEADIVAEESYGRQIGKLLDAVAELIAERGGDKQPKPLAELLALRQRVEKIKTESARRRLDQMQQDLQRLKDKDPVAYEAEIASLRRLLSDSL